ncbi:MAG: glycine cleavage system aminomethyltransferase GcvT [Pseudomonadota bacterium]
MQAAQNSGNEALLSTPLTHIHREMGAKMVIFAGYDMPAFFQGGLIEHHHVRNDGIGAFDVSHMGQFTLSGPNVSQELEKIFPTHIETLKAGKCKYTFLLNERGGVIDDVILSKKEDGSVAIVANGSRKYHVEAHLKEHLSDHISVALHEDKALIALQGAKAARFLVAHCPQISALKFMEAASFSIEGFGVHISRTGYTGEDGYEISCLAHSAEGFYKLLLENEDMMPAGLAARDTLRLEAGLCLYGQDLTEETSPVAANLSWCLTRKKTIDDIYIVRTIFQMLFDS